MARRSYPAGPDLVRTISNGKAEMSIDGQSLNLATIRVVGGCNRPEPYN